MIYLDNAATTKPNTDALNYASKYNLDKYFNPSALYHEGLENNKAIKQAKDSILTSLKLLPNEYEVIFTSCGSESDNQAIFCSVKKGCYLTTAGEHSAVFQSFNELKQRGNTVYFAKLNNDGSVNIPSVLDIVKSNRVDFISVVHVNNETGAINDINLIAKLVKDINPKIVFHSDGVQAFGKINYQISNLIDLYSISAHKINALKGTGALIKRKKQNVAPLIYGGGQENGLRNGTENIFGIKVFENATINHYKNLNNNLEKVNLIKNYFINNLDKSIFKIISSENSSPYILSISAVGLRGEVIMHALEPEGIIVGNGSACSSKHRHSRVLKECGYSHEVLDGVIRLSFSQENTIEEAIFVCDKINDVARNFKKIM